MNAHTMTKNPRLDRTKTRTTAEPISFPLSHRMAPLAGEIELAPLYRKLSETERQEQQARTIGRKAERVFMPGVPILLFVIIALVVLNLLRIV